MKKRVGFIGGVTLAVILVVVLGLIVMCTTRVPAGYVAVQYSMNGGVKDVVLTQGWHIVPPTVKTTLYTVGIEQSYLSSDKKGDSPDDESFECSSSEGKAIQVDLTYTYQYNADSVVKVFNQFKGQSGKEVRDSFIKPNIVSWTKEIIAKHKVADIIGAERANINIELTDYLSQRFKNYGITVSNASMINLSVDETTMNAINEKINAQQAAETQKINNQTAIDKAEADATVKKTQAQADADAKLIEAEAEAEANRKIAESLTADLIESQKISKWNGSVPQVEGGGTPIISIKSSEE